MSPFQLHFLHVHVHRYIHTQFHVSMHTLAGPTERMKGQGSIALCILHKKWKHRVMLVIFNNKSIQTISPKCSFFSNTLVHVESDYFMHVYMQMYQKISISLTGKFQLTKDICRNAQVSFLDPTRKSHVFANKLDFID